VSLSRSCSRWPGRWRRIAHLAPRLVVHLKGDTAAERQVGNLSSLVIFRIENRDVASLLCERLPYVEIVGGRASFSRSDGKDGFSRRNEANVKFCVLGFRRPAHLARTRAAPAGRSCRA